MIALLLGSALAGQDSLAVDVGFLSHPSGSYESLSNVGIYTSYGLRYRMGLLPDRNLYLSTSLDISPNSSSWDLGDQEGRLHTRLTGNSLGAGLHYEVPLAHSFRFYAAGEAELHTALVRLDEDPNDRENLNQSRHFGLAPGFSVVAGADLRPWGRGMGESDVSPLLFLEMGYGLTGSLDVGDLGELQYGGFELRSGIGLSF